MISHITGPDPNPNYRGRGRTEASGKLWLRGTPVLAVSGPVLRGSPGLQNVNNSHTERNDSVEKAGKIRLIKRLREAVSPFSQITG
ncbi:hypothetical protein KL921_001571 [Ogataea angusta]|uniref:Uncharacterized protein n=1 Tax=Pichia angusta TaxID=870730 RepID=A0AAN6I5B2_PICAN|nr:uncharacterized protein KL928_002807 [Ogataea angusta]KAG7812339.1 hypothetical protein KL921_001571 [Ogataea angusta]KAG7818939.1 hypothetical protein KL928_002807 [Ogataea angusta]KAG7825186.1 hypothetical protein KL909_001478 [Ogataea angusta]KAG7830373.1 hypothetical protein KL920_002011 [Ogataea angusta]KAG7834496.1 hypothetical protein KL943_002880 [Ogataea angusta]